MKRFHIKNSYMYRSFYLIPAIFFALVFVSLVQAMLNNDIPLVILYLSLLVFIVVVTGVFSLPSVKGKIGEIRVAHSLKKVAGKNDVLINNVIVPGDDGKTSQIDHILISTKGVFVIETKNMSGRIYGNEASLKWTQVLNYGHVKNQFYSPIKQNQTHIYRLKNIIEEPVSMTSVVVFVSNNIDYIDAEVYGPGSMKKMIRKAKDGVLDSEQILRIASEIQKYKDEPLQTTKEHIQEIHATQASIANDICPRCGGKLVVRHSKDGREFMGCENYPKCSFTKRK